MTLATGTTGVAVAVVNSPGPGRLYLLDLATGQVRWQAATLVGAGPLLTAADVISLAWETVLPEDVEDSPNPVPGQGVLIQPDSPFSGCAPVPV